MTAVNILRTEIGLYCVGHPGRHDLRLSSRLGGPGGIALAEAARAAITHAFTGDPDREDRLAVPRAVLARSVGDQLVTDAEVAALIEAVESGREYMIANRYGDDDDFPDDAAAARALQNSLLVDICWVGRS